MAGGQHEQTGFTPDQVVKGVSSTICIAVPSLRCKSVHPLVLEPEAIVGRVEGSSSSGSNSNAHRSRRVHTGRAEAIMWERAQTDTALLHDMYTSGSVRPHAASSSSPEGNNTDRGKCHEEYYSYNIKKWYLMLLK